MKRFRFILFGKVKEFYAPKNDFVRKFIKSNPQLGKLKLSELKNRTIVS
jgi:hypothetical protein